MSVLLPNTAHEIKANQNDSKVIRICVASINIEINCLYGSHFWGFEYYLKAFHTPDITLCVSQEEIDCERLQHTEIKPPVIEVESEKVAVTYDYGCLEPFVILQKLAAAVIPFDVILMHGAVLEKNGYAYMFSAPSGTGKTTRAQLWRNQYPDSIIVNGDKPLIKVCHDGIWACGTPWCGKEGWNTNTMVPLRAIFLLERADEGEPDSVTEISLGKAFPFLLQQTYRPADSVAMRKTIQLLKALEGKVKFYKFRSHPTTESVRLAYETARLKDDA